MSFVSYWQTNLVPLRYKIINGFSSGRNYFDDGIVTVNYFSIGKPALPESEDPEKKEITDPEEIPDDINIDLDSG